MPLLDPGLVLVDLEHVDRLLFGIRCQREDPIHGRRLRNACRVGGHMQTRHAFDDAAENGVGRGLATGCGLERLDSIPLYLDRDPLLGTLLCYDLIDALSNRCVRLRPAHAPEIKALQPLYRALDPLVAIARIALLLLARSVPVEREPLPQMIGAHRAFDDIAVHRRSPRSSAPTPALPRAPCAR